MCNIFQKRKNIGCARIKLGAWSTDAVSIITWPLGNESNEKIVESNDLIVEKDAEIEKLTKNYESDLMAQEAALKSKTETTDALEKKLETMEMMK